jgi:hypothetical protein
MVDGRSISHKVIDFVGEVADAFLGNERQTSMMQFAQKHKMKFSKRLKYEALDVDIKFFEVFKKKASRKITNIVSSTLPDIGDFQLFDCSVRTDAGKSLSTCLLYKVKSLDLPLFIIRPKRSSEKIGHLFVQKPKQEIDRDFGKHFILNTEDIEAVEPLLTEDLITLLVEDRKISIEGNGHYVMIYKKNKLADLKDLPGFIQTGHDLVDNILFDDSKEYV